MRNIISFMHISLDGFVAGPNGEMNWITVNEEIFSHVEKRISTTNAALYGRFTYNMMENYWPTAADKANASSHDINHSKWYKEAHKIVLSKSLSGSALPNTTIVGDHIADTLTEIRKADGPDILVFGSPTATHSLMELDLIDGYWLFINPIVLGEGIALFNGHQQSAKLKLVSTHHFSSGVVEVNYLKQ